MSLATGRRRFPLEPRARRTAVGVLVVLIAALATVLLRCSSAESPTSMSPSAMNPPATTPSTPTMASAPVVPPAAPPSSAGSPSTPPTTAVVWTGDFENGLSGWEPRIAAPERAEVYPTGSLVGPTPRQGRSAARLTAEDTDFRSPNVRAQLDGTYGVREGDDFYWRFSVYFPVEFPTTAGLDPNFFTFAEFMGPPYDGPSAFGNVSVIGDGAGGQRLAWVRGPEAGYDQPWTAPLERGRWHDFVFHVVFSRDASRGSVQLWYDGASQLLAGAATLPTQTIRASNTQGLFPVLTNYRTAGSVPGPVTIFVDGAVLGRTLASVGGPGDP